MDKPTKAEINRRKKLIAEMVNSEGWIYFKGMMDEWARISQEELVIGENDSSDGMLERAYKYKYGVKAFTWLVNTAEIIRDGLDKKE